MKKLMMGLVLGLLAQGAWADEHGAAAGSGSGTDRASACSMAKSLADARIPWSSTITGHSGCDCSKNETSEWWNCTVDAYWEKK